MEVTLHIPVIVEIRLTTLREFCSGKIEVIRAIRYCIIEEDPIFILILFPET